jgi:hypothetical protein
MNQLKNGAAPMLTAGTELAGPSVNNEVTW